jgi:hypothetical protein
VIESRAGATMPPSMPLLTTKLSELRTDAGQPSYREMSRRTTIAVATLHDIFTGRAMPRWDSIERIVKYLGGDVDDFRRLWSETVRLKASGRPGQQWVDFPGSLLPTGPLSPDEISSLRESDLSIYVSYARKDDEATYGRIAELVSGVAHFCENDTGQNVHVFQDVDPIEPKDDWKDRIRLGLSSSTIFLAFISPAYFRSVDCRKEFSEIMSFLEIGSESSLIIPLLSAKLDKMARYFSADNLWKRATALQWIDISRLRTLEPGSGNWLDLVDHIAARIDDVHTALNSHGQGQVDESRDDSNLTADLLDSLDMYELERSGDHFFKGLHDIKILFGQVTHIIQDSVPELQAAQVFADKYRVSQKMEASLPPLVVELSSISEVLVASFARLDAVMRILFGSDYRHILQVQEGPDHARTQQADLITEILGILKRTLSSGYEDLRHAAAIYKIASEAMGYSGSLDQVLGEIQVTCLQLTDLSAVVKMWLEEVRLSQSFPFHL